MTTIFFEEISSDEVPRVKRPEHPQLGRHIHRSTTRLVHLTIAPGSPEKHRPPIFTNFGLQHGNFWEGFLLVLGGGFKKFSFPDTQRGLVYLPTFGVIAPYSTLSIWVCVSLCIKKRYDVTHGFLTGLKAAPFEIRHGSGCRSFFLRRWWVVRKFTQDIPKWFDNWNLILTSHENRCKPTRFHEIALNNMTTTPMPHPKRNHCLKALSPPDDLSQTPKKKTI